MKMYKHIFFFLFLFSLLTACSDKQKTDFSVLQINLWHEGRQVPEGMTGIVDIIDQIDADAVFLCEINNHGGELFMPKLLKALQEKGRNYFGESLDMSVGILSKYPLNNPVSVCTLENNTRPIIKASVNVDGRPVMLYSAHLDYTHYECFMPRGYSGTTWKKIEAPVTDVNTILEANRISYRDEAIAAFIADAKQEKEKGNLIIMGGDFNEPSHLDWQADTKDLWDHNGVVIDWDCSVMLQKAGYIDTFREKYPDAVNYPGFTFPSANPDVAVDKLAWAPEADERDRIDFIYYFAQNEIKLKEISIVGPEQTVSYGKTGPVDSQDSFIKPKGIWPTDHKAMFALFSIDN